MVELQKDEPSQLFLCLRNLKHQKSIDCILEQDLRVSNTIRIRNCNKNFPCKVHKYDTHHEPMCALILVFNSFWLLLVLSTHPIDYVLQLL